MSEPCLDPERASRAGHRASRKRPESGRSGQGLDRRGFLAVAGGGVSALATAHLLGLPGLLPLFRGEGQPTAPVLEGFRFLTSDPAYVDTRPCFSPSGREVLFMRSPAGDDPVATLNSNRSPWSLWTVPADGGAPRPFFDPPTLRATRPDWSWTSDRIAFSGVRDGRGELWVLDRSGEDPTHVTVEERYQGRLFYPSWYPDGESVAVTDYERQQVLRVEVATGRVEPLTDPSRVLAGLPSVSPDAAAGSPVAFAGQRPGGDYNAGSNSIWIRTEGGTRELVSGHGRMPWWSPSGDRLVFVSNRGRPAPATTLHPRELPPGVPSLFVVGVDVSGSTSGRVTGVSPLDQWTSFPRWSPDAGALVCRAMDLRSARAGIALLELRAPSTG